MDNIEALMSFGLTRQEANIYILLCREGELNGYEVSKLTGISRSNSYSALAGLVDKGASYIIEDGAVKYTPVNIKEFCENKIKFMENNKNSLIKSIPMKKIKDDGYITIKGKNHIMNKFTHMIVNAKERVYLFVCDEILNLVIDELNILREKKIKIVIITNSSFEFQGVKVYHKEQNLKQIRLIVDSKYVLTGEIEDEMNSTCLYSSNSNIVDVFKESLTNEIKLIEIKEGRDI